MIKDETEVCQAAEVLQRVDEAVLQGGRQSGRDAKYKKETVVQHYAP